MRLIDADKVLGVMRSKLQARTFSVMKIFIDEQPTVTRWISVKDKLPRKGECILCYDLNGAIYVEWSADPLLIKHSLLLYWMPIEKPQSLENPTIACNVDGGNNQ